MGCAHSHEQNTTKRQPIRTAWTHDCELPPEWPDETVDVDPDVAESALHVRMELAKDQESDGNSTDEGSPLSQTFRIKWRVVKASLSNDINDDPDQFPPDDESLPATEHRELARRIALWRSEIEGVRSEDDVEASLESSAPCSMASTLPGFVLPVNRSESLSKEGLAA